MESNEQAFPQDQFNSTEIIQSPKNRLVNYKTEYFYGLGNLNIAILMAIEVFKTTISNIQQTHLVLDKLKKEFPEARINIDMQDIDHVLRVEGSEIRPDRVVDIVLQAGFSCSALN